VVDLSSLWAGPLAGGLLAAAGARVVKVESTGRPDGARRGPAAFYDLLNHGKESVALDFTDPSDLDVLRALVARADIVIEASRPRVMPSLGIDPAAVAASGRTTWISISGHGRIGAGANRVAFGDDAAVAAGCTIGDPPRFVADAAADPIAGIYAACAGLAACAGERGQLIDIALVDAAAYACGGRIGAVTDAGTHAVAAPHARPVPGRAAPLGRDTDAVRAQLA
jgi:crotonobetainyl-CoA:carnitine CoA-transferase CaiB-like acyl-CoA transferase